MEEVETKPEKTTNNNPKKSFSERLKTNKSKILGIILGILVFAGGFYTGMFYEARWVATQKPLVGFPTTTPVAVATTIPDPTADWETYTAGILSLKYPPTWFVKETTSGFFVFLPNESLSPQSAPISLDTRLEKEYAQSIIEHKEGIEDLVVEDISIAGKPATKISGKLGPGFREGTPVIAIVINYQNKAVVFEFSGEGETYQQTFNLILSTFKFLEKGTPSPTPQLNNVPTLPTTDWKTVSNNGVSFKIPPEAICDNDNLCTKVTYTWDYQGHPISSYIYVGVSDYQGESRREKFLEKNTEVVDCRPVYEEALFGNIKALQVAIENGYCQGSSGGMVAVVGNKLVIIGGGLGYDPETKVIDRWSTRDTIISTLRM